MTYVGVDEFVGLLHDWARRRNAEFPYNWPVKGGWEAWIQVDLVAHVLRADSTADILREQAVFDNDRQRADLLLNTGEAAARQIPVEIKAESFENRRRPFVAGVVEDLSKLQDSRRSEYSTSTCLMIAVPFSPESRQDVLDIRVGGSIVFREIFTGEVSVLVAVWHRSSGWKT